MNTPLPEVLQRINDQLRMRFLREQIRLVEVEIEKNDRKKNYDLGMKRQAMAREYDKLVKKYFKVV